MGPTYRDLQGNHADAFSEPEEGDSDEPVVSELDFSQHPSRQGEYDDMFGDDGFESDIFMEDDSGLNSSPEDDIPEDFGDGFSIIETG